jgi:hypothetical protein
MTDTKEQHHRGDDDIWTADSLRSTSSKGSYVGMRQ